MHDLGDGEPFFALDGTANPIDTVSERDPVRLSDAAVVAVVSADVGRPAAGQAAVREIRQFYIPDFSTRQQRSRFEAALEDLPCNAPAGPAHKRVRDGAPAPSE